MKAVIPLGKPSLKKLSIGVAIRMQPEYDMTETATSDPYPQLIEGVVYHRRFSPKHHFLKSRIFYTLIPLRNLDKQQHASQLKWGSIIFGINRPSLVSLKDQDHGNGQPLLRWIESIIQSHELCDEIDGEIWLMSIPRVLGFQFKPVSFWFCENKSGQIKLIVAEVNNTFGERHSYALFPTNAKAGYVDGETLIAEKALYVSPFYKVEGRYHFTFKVNRTKKQICAIIDYVTDKIQLKTSFTGEKTPLNQRSCAIAWLKLPLMSFKIIAKIHWNALLIWAKRVPHTLGTRK